MTRTLFQRFFAPGLNLRRTSTPIMILLPSGINRADSQNRSPSVPNIHTQTPLISMESGPHVSPTPLSEGIILASSRPKKSAGRKKFRETRHPVYRGVRQRNSGKWVCELRNPNNVKSRIWVGTFPTAEMAARAHDVAAIALRGPTLCLNFADSTWRLPVPSSDDPKDIRRAAVEAAEAFRPKAPPDQGFASSSAAAADTSTQACLNDEDDVFRMPEVVADMYKGMMLSPPPLTFDDMAYDDMDSDFDVPLWSYTF